MYLTVRCPGVIYNNSIYLTFFRFLFTLTFQNIIKIDNNCQSRHEHHSCYALKAAHIRSFSSRQVCALERAIEYDLRTKMPELRIMLFNVIGHTHMAASLSEQNFLPLGQKPCPPLFYIEIIRKSSTKIL